ncbi:MAG: hypothetical protein ACFFA8_04360 [Promethearchaeota archaeon]
MILMLGQIVSDIAKLSGLSALINVFIGFFFGTIVLIRSIKTRQRLIFNFFLCIVFTLSPWYPSGFGYLYWSITNNLLPYQVYILLGNLFIPIAILAWINVYMTTYKPERKKIVLLLYGIFSIGFEIYIFSFLFFAPGAPIETILGVFTDIHNPIDIDYKGFVLIYLGVSIITACMTGIHFAIKSIKEKVDKSIVWKGRFLFVAFLCFGVAAIFDAIIEMTPLLLLVIRIILATNTFLFYLGFILPKWARKLLKIQD